MESKLLHRFFRAMGRLFLHLLRAWLSVLGGFLRFVGKVLAVGIPLASLAGAVLWYKVLREEPLPERAILSVSIEGGVPESLSFADQISALPRRQGGALLFGQYVESLWRAVEDPRILGVLVEFSGGGMPFFQAQELREVFLALRAHKKPVWVYGNALDTASYYCASAASHIVMPSSGTCAPTGFSLTLPFAKDGLEKLGITPTAWKRKEYKSFSEMFVEKGTTTASREAYTSILDAIKGQLEQGLQRDGRIKNVGAFLDGAPYMARESLSIGAIQGIKSYKSFRSGLRKHLSDKGKKPEYLSLGRYWAANSSDKDAAVAIIYLKGDVAESAQGLNSELITPEIVHSRLKGAGKDDQVKAIVLRINSPGGSITASEAVAAHIKEARDKYKKPIVVSMGGEAASGGYWISAPADYIVANPGTLTGSIGVVCCHFASAELMKKIGVNWEVFKTHTNADIEAGVKSLSETAKARYEAFVDNAYDLFIAHVSACRKRSRASVETVAKGRVWTGAQAYEYKLVDAQGGLRSAVQQALCLAGINQKQPVRWVHISPSLNTIFDIYGAILGEMETSGQRVLSILLRSFCRGKEFSECAQVFSPLVYE